MLWGPYVGLRTGWATDPQVRFGGSSGGALSMLVTSSGDGTVDAVIQTAASRSGHRQCHGDLAIGRGAGGGRIALCALGAAGRSAAHHLASTGQRFAFVGKPCDVGGPARDGRRDPAIAAAIPVMLSFFCAGVPVHQGGTAVLAHWAPILTRPAAFRYRGNGWPGQATATLQDGSAAVDELS